MLSNVLYLSAESSYEMSPRSAASTTLDISSMNKVCFFLVCSDRFSADVTILRISFNFRYVERWLTNRNY